MPYMLYMQSSPIMCFLRYCINGRVSYTITDEHSAVDRDAAVLELE